MKGNSTMNLDKTTEITITAEGVVTLSTAEYNRLVACTAMLDMILASRNEIGGYPNSVVVNCAGYLRKHQSVSPCSETENSEGEKDA